MKKTTTTNAHLKCYSHVIISCSAYKQGYSKTSPPGVSMRRRAVLLKSQPVLQERDGWRARGKWIPNARTPSRRSRPRTPRSCTAARTPTSRAPTAEPATRLLNPYQCYLSTRPDVVQWPKWERIRCDLFWVWRRVKLVNAKKNCVSVMRLFATLWMVWIGASSINVSVVLVTVRAELCGNGKLPRSHCG